MKRSAAVLVLLLANAPLVVGQSDTQPPQLVDVSFAPSTVDVTLSAQTVTIYGARHGQPFGHQFRLCNPSQPVRNPKPVWLRVSSLMVPFAVIVRDELAD